jgi:hypothetical protein
MYSPYARPRPATGVGFQLGVFDTSVLTTDVTAAVFRGRPSSILDGMRVRLVLAVRFDQEPRPGR